MRLSHSSRKALHTCPRKYMLASRFSKPYKPLPNMRLGVAFHKLMELSLTVNPDDILTKYDTWCQAVMHDNEDQPEDVQADLILVHQEAIPLWQGYLSHVPRLKPRLVKVLGTEHRFMHQVEGVDFSGVIDLLAIIENPYYQSTAIGAVGPDQKEILAIGDYKSTSLNLDSYLQALQKSDQLATYAIWAQSKDFAEEFPDVVAEYGHPQAVFLDLIHVLKICQKKTESLDDYLERYRVDVTFSEEGVQRHVYFPSARSLEDTHRGIATDRKAIEGYIAADFWPKHENSCLLFGTTLCDYSMECTEFTEGHYDPKPRLIQLTEINQDNGDNDQAYE